MPKFLSQLKGLPKNQRLALGGGAAVAGVAGVYTYRKRKAAGTTAAPAATPVSATPIMSTLSPANPNQQGVTVPASAVPVTTPAVPAFGGPGGLTGPLAPPQLAGPATTDFQGGRTQLFSEPANVNSYTPGGNWVPAYVGADASVPPVHIGPYNPTTGGIAQVAPGPYGQMLLGPGGLEALQAYNKQQGK